MLVATGLPVKTTGQSSNTTAASSNLNDKDSVANGTENNIKLESTDEITETNNEGTEEPTVSNNLDAMYMSSGVPYRYYPSADILSVLSTATVKSEVQFQAYEVLFLCLMIH